MGISEEFDLREKQVVMAAKIQFLEEEYRKLFNRVKEVQGQFGLKAFYHRQLDKLPSEFSKALPSDFPKDVRDELVAHIYSLINKLFGYEPDH